MNRTMAGLLTCIVSAGLGLCVVPGTAKADYYYAGCMQNLIQKNGWKYQEADYLCRCGQVLDGSGYSLETVVSFCLKQYHDNKKPMI